MSRHQEFLDVYRSSRFEDQRGWYQQRVREFERAHDQVLTMTGAALFGASAAGLAASADLGGFRTGWALIAAVMSGLATLVRAYDQLVGHEQHLKVYRDALAAVGALRARAPWLEGTDPRAESVAEFVAAAEAVFQREIGQWGQLAAPQLPDEEADAPQARDP